MDKVNLTMVQGASNKKCQISKIRTNGTSLQVMVIPKLNLSSEISIPNSWCSKFLAEDWALQPDPKNMPPNQVILGADVTHIHPIPILGQK